MSDRKAVIKNADMGEEMQQDAVDCATQALEKYNIEKVSHIISFYVIGVFFFSMTFRYVHPLQNAINLYVKTIKKNTQVPKKIYLLC